MISDKHCLGDLIELREVYNTEGSYGPEYVRGVNNLKEMMPTKADLNGRDLTKFHIVYHGEFVFNHRTSRNGSKFSIAYNDGDEPIICTEDYVVFRIREDCKDKLLERWLYMYFNRPEFDRYVIVNSWGSSTEFYNWNDICDVELNIPPLERQKEYVDIYEAMVENQKCYERGLEDLKLTCDGYIDELKDKLPNEAIGPYITECDERNDIGLTVDSVRGLSTSKEMIDTKANMSGVSLSNYKVFKPGEIAYVPDTTRRGDKVSMAMNDTDEKYLVSSISTVFGTNPDRLLPEYLMLFLTRSEFDRYARFHSWGSARETFTFTDMREVRMPIPDIEIQRSLADIYNVYTERKRINEKLKDRIRHICPILVKESLEYGG